MAEAKASEAAPGFFEDDAKQRKPRASRPKRRLMGLQRAYNRGLIRTKRDMRGAVEIAANAFFEIARRLKVRKADPVEHLQEWCERRNLRLSKTAFGAVVRKWHKPDLGSDDIVVVVFGRRANRKTARSRAGAIVLILLASKPGDFWGYSPASENEGHSESNLGKNVVSAHPSFWPHTAQTLGFREAHEGTGELFGL
jgi:hypothetical protein